MAALNKVMVIGNLGQDADMRYLSTGVAKVEFSVAVNSRRKHNGEWSEHTEWVNVVLFGEYGERVAEYLRRGTLVYVEGRLQTRSWESDSGERRYRTEVVGQTVQLLGGRNEMSPQERPAARQQYAEDLPFE